MNDRRRGTISESDVDTSLHIWYTASDPHEHPEPEMCECHQHVFGHDRGRSQSSWAKQAMTTSELHRIKTENDFCRTISKSEEHYVVSVTEDLRDFCADPGTHFQTLRKNLAKLCERDQALTDYEQHVVQEAERQLIRQWLTPCDPSLGRSDALVHSSCSDVLSNAQS